MLNDVDLELGPTNSPSRLKPQARRMLPSARLGNQFDTLGTPLAQYMPVFSLTSDTRWLWTGVQDGDSDRACEDSARFLWNC
jgi:hypothetical protein